MIISILKNVVIINCLFLASIGITFTILSNKVDIPDTTQYRLFKEKIKLNSFETTVKSIEFMHDSLKRELNLKKNDFESELIIIDSLLVHLNKMEIRMNLNQKKNKNI